VARTAKLFRNGRSQAIRLLTTSPKAILSAGTLLRMSGVDEKVHENREEHKAEMPLGQNSAVRNGTTENWQAVSEEKKEFVMVELVGIEPTTSSLRTMRSPS
jgi:hypothetical protein